MAAPLVQPPPPAQILLHLAQALRVNGLEQLCSNLASERLQLFSSQKLLAQEEVGSWAQTWQVMEHTAQHRGQSSWEILPQSPLSIVGGKGPSFLTSVYICKRRRISVISLCPHKRGLRVIKYWLFLGGMPAGDAELGAHNPASEGVLPGPPGGPASQPSEHTGRPDMAIPGIPAVSMLSVRDQEWGL